MGINSQEILRFQISSLLTTLVEHRHRALVLLVVDSLKYSNSNQLWEAFNSSLIWEAFNSNNLIWALEVETTRLIHSVHLTLVAAALSLSRTRPRRSALLVRDLASQPPSRIKLQISSVH